MADQNQSTLPAMLNVACENCGHLGLETFISNSHQQLYFCSDCLLYQKGNMPEAELYENYYHSGYQQRKKSKTVTALVRLQAITKYLNVAKPRMLDVGCSIGATVAAAEKMGWRPSGVDISQAAVDFCVTEGHDCYKIDGSELPFADNTFDVVSSWHVIEHVADVNETLQEWKRVLKPGGVLVFETPDSQCLKARRMGAEYAKFWPLGHIYTFTRSNMCSLLEKHEFEVLPSKILGKLNSTTPQYMAYAAAYRSWRKLFRAFGLCKSIEVCCRKPAVDATESKVRVAA